MNPFPCPIWFTPPTVLILNPCSLGQGLGRAGLMVGVVVVMQHMPVEPKHKLHNLCVLTPAFRARRQAELHHERESSSRQ